MMRFFVVLLLAFSSISAQAELSYELLAKLTDSPKTLTGDFTQEKHLSQFDATISSQGTFSYKRGAYIRWITEKPIKNELTMTTKDIISRQGDNEMLRIDTDKNPAAQIMNRIFFAVMTAEWHTLSGYFSATGKQSGAAWSVTLTPKNDVLKQHISLVELQGDRLLRTLTLQEKNGDSTQINFTNLRE